MINAIEIYGMDVKNRKELIIDSSGIRKEDNELIISKKLSSTINTFIYDYFGIHEAEDKARNSGSILDIKNLLLAIDAEVESFKPLAIQKLKESSRSYEEIEKRPVNVYELAGASKLAAANRATRNLSTTLGLLWERVANISPYSINPEIEFNIKIKGIDLISSNVFNKKIEYQQLKTQKNTLTGSQKSRSIQELMLYENPVFCACFELGAWTFNSPVIPRISGKAFWSRIGIDYPTFESRAKNLMMDLEQEFLKL